MKNEAAVGEASLNMFLQAQEDASKPAKAEKKDDDEEALDPTVRCHCSPANRLM